MEQTGYGGQQTAQSPQGFTADYDQRRFDEAVSKAYIDQDFRARLIADPNGTLAEEGVVFPENVRIMVHEFDMNERHIFLPPPGGPVVEPRSWVGERPPNVPPDDPQPSGVQHFGVARIFLRPSEGGVPSEGGQYYSEAEQESSSPRKPAQQGYE
jgi:hypothetical protein